MAFLSLSPKVRIIVFAYVFIFPLVALPVIIFSQGMGSQSYQIQADSINIGGIDSDSENFVMSDTIGEIATGDSGSDNYALAAGFQQADDVYISLSAPSDLDLGSLSGFTGGSAEGSLAWTVTTNNNSGYELYIESGSVPALTSSAASFADYVPVGAIADFAFMDPSSNAIFGFTPEGAHLVARFKDDGGECGTGSLDTASACWDGLSTTPQIIAGSALANATAGTGITVRLRAASGSEYLLPSGDYAASVIVTAVAI